MDKRKEQEKYGKNEENSEILDEERGTGIVSKKTSISSEESKGLKEIPLNMSEKKEREEYKEKVRQMMT